MAVVRFAAAHWHVPYRCVIGVDPSGLRIANWYSRLLRVPLVYYSLELLLDKEIGENDRLRELKNAEVAASRRSAFSIIQDEARADLLKRENSLRNDQIVCVPNSPLKRSAVGKGAWHQKLDLPPTARVVLVSGSVAAWSGIKEIIQSTDGWPEKWVLVIHTRAAHQDSPYIAELFSAAARSRPIYFSLNPVPRKQYDDLVASADIGIAFYVPQPESIYTQENIRTIGLSSGKIAYYLRAGLPVIVNDATSLAEFVQVTGCGIVVSSTAEIGDAIQEIDERYSEFSRRAYLAFERHFDFERHFAAVLRRLDALKGEPRKQRSAWLRLSGLGGRPGSGCREKI
jgi:glycosyltransferase involved in cell wall biosynthesis